MTLVLRPTELALSDYSVIYRHDDGRELQVGRIYQTGRPVEGYDKVWRWTLALEQRQWRWPPQQGHTETLEEATAAFKRCWESSTEIQLPTRAKRIRS